MTYPRASAGQIAFFEEHGFLVVADAIPSADLDELERRCDRLLDDRERLANDWAWDEAESLEERSFRIVQSSPSFVWRDIAKAPYRIWLAEFGEALMRRRLEFWYDQFLAKPPGRSVPTAWHQDEGYWGRNLDDRGVTAWIPLQDVDPTNGCMHFIDRGHRLGVLPHHRVAGMQSDLLTCEVDERSMIACPIRRGDVTFHHSKTPHMTPANTGKAWRKAVSNHLQAVGAGGEGDHYPWKVTVDQKIGQPKPRAPGGPMTPPMAHEGPAQAGEAIAVSGRCDEPFAAVRAAFADNLSSGRDLGASVAVFLDGRPVIDLWGGVADPATGAPWRADTIVPTASCTKTATALTALLLADRGEIDLDAPVCRYWPAFAANGKGGVLVRHCLGHTAGLPGWDEPLVFADLYDWEKVTALLAAQAPWWEPGTASAYHAHTMGFLVGEIVRRVAGRSIGTVFANEVAGPLGADYHIGLDPRHDHRLGRIVMSDAAPPPPAPPPDSIAARIIANPVTDLADLSGDEQFVRAEIPAGNGCGNARSLGLMLSLLACGGEVAGRRLMSPEGCEAVLRQQSDGVDLGFLAPVRWGLGFALQLGAMTLGPRACFWGGHGGSLVVVDLERRLSFAYVMNRTVGAPFGDRRNASLLAATYAGLNA